MLEVVFDASAAGSLKAAQHFGEGKFDPAVIGMIAGCNDGMEITGEDQQRVIQRERRRWEQARPMGGSPEDVFDLGLAHSVGTLNDGWAGREKTMARLLSVCEGESSVQAARLFCDRVRRDLARFEERVRAGEPVRVWYSDKPNDLCGLCWLCGWMRERGLLPQRILLIKLPDWEEDRKMVVEYSGWGELSPEQWHRYLPLQREVPDALFHALALRWRQLEEENTSLRAVLSGKLCSVGEDFYDGLIQRELCGMEREFFEAVLIARLLGKYPIGVGDGWYHLRIQAMADRGKLEVIEGSGCRRKLRKSAAEG